MNFTKKKSLDEQVFTVTIDFASFGATNMTAEEEQALIQDLGAPIIDIGGQYTGKYAVGADSKIAADATNGDAVSVIINSKKVSVTTGFHAELSVDAKKIPATELTGTTLKTALLMAEAKCDLFADSVAQKITTAINDLRTKATTYEKSSPETFTV